MTYSTQLTNSIRFRKQLRVFLLLLTMVFLPVEGYSQTIFNTPGAKTYVAPTGTTKIKVECWGAGGGGSTITARGARGGGGGGGAYATSVISMPSGTYNLTVGAGGAASTVGQNSTFGSNLVVAAGGKGGANNSNTAGAGGSTGSIGTTILAGGGGANGGSSYSGGGGGGAGSTAAGGAASGQTGGTGGSLNGGKGADGVSGSSNGGVGGNYGAGGSGAVTNTNTDRIGGAGAGGLIIVTPLNFVEVTATTGTSLFSYYSTLKEAFDAINAGTHKGVISIRILANTTETATATLFASGGTSSYTSINIYPNAAGLTIAGNVTGALVALNGTQNITIDGRVGATGSSASLTFSNNNTTAGAATILFNGSAQSNTLKYCLVKGGGTSTTSGTVQFGATGSNSNNTVTYCEITNNGNRRPYAVYSLTGTNTGNILTYNSIDDNWLTTGSSSSIYLGTGASAWTITDNSFYDTGIGTVGAGTYSAITLNNPAATGMIVSRNFIGGESSQCGGSDMSMGTATPASTSLIPISLNVTSANVQGNVIQNITYRSSNTAPFTGIHVAAGNVTLDGNLIGDPSGLAPLTITETTTSSTSYGINLASAGTVNVTNNVISSIILDATTSTFAHNFTAINQTAVAATLTLTGNVIGHASTAGSIAINSTGTAAAQVFYGINSAGTGTTIISNNTVANLVNSTTNTNTLTAGAIVGVCSSAGTNTVSGNTIHDLSISNASTSTALPSVSGLLLTSAVAGKTVTGNTVYNLNNTYAAAAAIRVCGLYYAGATTGTNLVSKNFIYGLSAGNTSALIYGIFMNTGLTTYANNIVSLASLNSNCSVYGVYDSGSASSNTNFWYNSVYIGGSATSSNSYALFNLASGNVRDYRNNILYNARSRTTSGSHFAMYITASTGTIVANYNEYYASGTGAVLGYFAANKTALPIVSSQDGNSLVSGPTIFTNPGGSNPTDYKTFLQLPGVAGTGIATDFGDVTRTVFTMGAWEFLPVEVWNGTTYRAGFSSLKLAFDKINDGTWTGDLICKIAGNVNETSTAILNNSSAPASYSSLTLYPTTANLTVSGNLAGALIHLNGADNVTIDGRVNGVGSTVSMVITNTNASGSALYMNNSAQNNTVKYCTLQSTGSNAIVYFPSDAPTGATNHNNSLINNILTPSSGRVNAAISVPTIGTATYNGLVIQDNSIYNTWNPAANSYGINFSPTTASSGISVIGNSFYETSDFQPTGAYTYYGINIDNASLTNVLVSNNFIGGQAAFCGGGALALGNSVAAQSLTFIPVRMKVGTSIASSVQGNTIRNISFKSSSTTPFTALSIESGNVNVGTETGNTIGATTGNGSIVLTGTATSVLSMGIGVASNSSVTVSSNSVGSVTTVNASANAYSFYGIGKTNGAVGKLRVANNLIGSSTTSSSLQSSSAATGFAQTLVGIYTLASDSVFVEENQIANLYNGTTRNDANAFLCGIYSNGGNANKVSGNFVLNLNMASAGTSNVLAGLCLESGSMLVYNNIVYLGGGITTGSYEISGIKAKTSALPGAYYHNTVYIAGSYTGNTAVHSYAFNKAFNNGTLVLKNNIFFNARTGGTGAGKHLAVYIGNTTGFTSDYNILHAPGSNGVLGMVGSTSYNTMIDWRSATGTDDNSANANPTFSLAGGVLADNYKAGLSLPGFTGSGVTLDFGGSNRVLWTAGAWEGAMNQLQVWNGDVLRASYVTLKDAIDKINDGTWMGDLIIKINASTNESASVVLNASGTGSANYSKLLIYPLSSGISIVGNINGPLLSLNGADNVAINGSVYLNNTAPGLTFVNNSTGASASTIKFSESAQNNSIRFCQLKGNSASATQGIVLFSTSSIGTGNSNDTIANCTISGTGTTTANRPYNALFSLGSSGKENANIVISANDFLDFLNPGFASNGILVSNFSNTLTIRDNSFFETSSFVSSAAVAYTAININNTSGGGFLVSGNYIGGNGPLATGTWVKTGNNNVFSAIALNVGSANLSNIQGNTIKGFNHTNSLNADWYGINITSGVVDVGSLTGNTLGDGIGTESIKITNNTTSGSFYGIYINSTSDITCSNNSLGSISVGTGTSTLSMNFYGIYKVAGAGNFTVSNNTVGGLNTVNSLYARSLATANVQTMFGIYSAGTALNTISGNTVANLANATTSNLLSFTRGIFTLSGSNTIDNNSVHHISSLNAQANNYLNASLIGIEQVSEQAGSIQKVRGNQVYSLKNITLSTIEMYGIFYRGPAIGEHEISRNFVNTFIIISTDAAYLHGISLHSGKFACYDNIVFLGDTITTGCHIWGIWNNSNSPISIYHNTVYLNGTATTGVSNTFAFRDISSAPTSRDIRNNIFWNGRKNVSTISHYALYFAQTTNTTLDYNDYQFAENFALVGSFAYPKLEDWVAGTAFDDSSFTLDPELTNLGGVSPSDYQTGVALRGIPISGMTTDFGLAERSLTSPTMGAWEYVPNPVEIWNGSIFRKDYATLKLAFDAINSATWTGDLTIKIRANLRETSKAVLYQSGYTGNGGTSNYSRVWIMPTRSDIQVLSKLPTPLIELNGAKGVVFDGRINGTGAAYNLTLQNDSVSTTASTILFLNSAESDTLKYCYIKGLSSNPNGGIIHFSTSDAGNGNSNNCILGNKITVVDSKPAIKSRVINAIYSQGSVSIPNNGNLIKDNEIYDVWSQGATSSSIHASLYSTAFSITGNSIYETTTFTPSSENSYHGIRVDSPTGSGFAISGNYIGGKAIQCQGLPLLIGTTNSTNKFNVLPIFVNAGTANATSIQGNIIRNFRVTSPNAVPFKAISLEGGTVNVGTIAGNTIGNGTGVGSIALFGTLPSSDSYGIYVNTSGNVTISNNTIGSVTANVTGNTTNAHSLYGIFKSNAAGSLAIIGNTIGSQTTAASIRASSLSTGNSQSVYGIYTLGTGPTSIVNNVIANLMDSTTNNLATSNLEAIYFGGSSSVANSIHRNFIYGLSHAVTASSANNRIVGIRLVSGRSNTANNIIWLGNGTATNLGLFGIYQDGVSGQVDSVYHNTVYVSGSAGTSSNTAAFYKASINGTTNLRNNILYNNRTSTVSGKHFAVYLPSISGVTINANDYITAGTVLNYLGADVSDLPAWKLATGQDQASKNLVPFPTPSTTLATSFRPTLDLQGVSVGTLYDYGLNPRSSTSPTIGAWERVNKWKGSVSIDFNTAGNWTFNMVPSAYDNVIFDDAPNRPCTLDQDRFIQDIVNNQATYRMIVNGFKLTVRGNLTFSNGAQVDASMVGSTLEFNGTAPQVLPSGAFFTNKVYNLTINNPSNVTLNGILILLNNLNVSSGRLNASQAGCTFIYGGSAAQTIEGNCFLNNEMYNLTIANAAGVVLNTNLTARNNMTIQTGTSFVLSETKGLTVLGTLSNAAGAGALLLKSSAAGTASLIESTPGVAATVQRYIDGDTCAWHFLSTPIATQSISGSWIPSGTYGDGTGYDLYAWDEPASCWIYNLNTTVAPTWPGSHPESYFVPGRGYLYAVQALHPTKQFVGSLNTGPITRNLTVAAAGVYNGFNLLGNPYPSTINWSNADGFDRNLLNLNGGGYDIWTWSTTTNNYGVYNSADADGVGTNHVTQYIAPMQAFFVRAVNSGTFTFENDARVHDSASVWLKSAKAVQTTSSIWLSVSTPQGGDEVKLNFGHTGYEGGALKLFSPVETAPSLYMKSRGQFYSTIRLSDPAKNKYVAVNFKHGSTGACTLRWKYDASTMGALFLQDRLTGAIVDLSTENSYEFTASSNDIPERFVLHFGSVSPVDMEIHPNVWISAGRLTVYLENMIGDFTMRVTDLNGRLVRLEKMSGNDECSMALFGRGIYLVTVSNGVKKQTVKVLY